MGSRTFLLLLLLLLCLVVLMWTTNRTRLITMAAPTSRQKKKDPATAPASLDLDGPLPSPEHTIKEENIVLEISSITCKYSDINGPARRLALFRINEYVRSLLYQPCFSMGSNGILHIARVYSTVVCESLENL